MNTIHNDMTIICISFLVEGNTILGGAPHRFLPFITP